MQKKDSSLVWSSQQGDLRKKSPASAVVISLPPAQQNIIVGRESKGRAGKAVTLVRNLQLSADDLAALAKSLRQNCGSGGTLKDGVIEIQGDHREKIAQLLKGLGYKVKVAGG
jgi:translation initiation factor 1